MRVKSLIKYTYTVHLDDQILIFKTFLISVGVR